MPASDLRHRAAVVLFCSVFLLYSDQVYTRLPHELGGIRPRCVFIDVDLKQMSTDTWSVLAPDSVTGETTQEVGTAEVWLLFGAGETLYVRPRHPEGNGPPIIALRAGVVKTISSCPSEPEPPGPDAESAIEGGTTPPLPTSGEQGDDPT